MWMRGWLAAAAWLWGVSAGVAAEVCQPSEWGAEDQIGAANRITPERTLAAARLVKQGASHPLGIVISPGMPAYPPRYTCLLYTSPSPRDATLSRMPSSA